MNINSINAMMLNKNMKLRAMENPQEPQRPEGLANVPSDETSANPQEGMEALAKRNMAFMGMHQLMGKFTGAAKTAMVGLAGLTVAASTVSCEKEDPVRIPVYGGTVIVNNFIDLSFMAEFIKAMQDSNNLTQQQLDELNEKLQELIDLQKQQGVENAEFQKKAYELGLEILKQTIINNEHNETINDKLDGLYAQIANIEARVKAGQITYEDALKEIQALLNAIQNDLGDIKEILKDGINTIMEYAKASDEKLFSYLSDMQTKYENNEMTEAEYNKKMLDTIVAYQEAIINILKQNGGMSEAEARAYLDKIVSQLGDLNAKLDAVIDILKNISEDVANLSDKYEKYSNEFLELAKDADADREEMKAKLDLANNYLYLLNEKADKHNENLENLKLEFGNITIDQLKEILGEQSDAWMSFIKGQTALLLEGMEGLNDLGSLTLEELVQLNKTAMEIKNGINGLDQLAAKIDWNTAETLGVAQEIRDLLAQGHECNCEADLKIIIELIQKIVDDPKNEGILDNL